MTSQHRSFWLTPRGLSALGLIVAVSYFLLMEHRQHLFQWLPFLILALCPLMHIFMHGNHGGHGHAHGHGDRTHHDDKDEAYRRGVEDGKNQSNRSIEKDDHAR